MKAPFTVFQVILTSLSSAALTLCISADLFLLLVDRGTVSESALTINLIMSVLILVLSVLLIFKAGSVDTFGRAQEDEDKLPAVRALRTYFCMLSCDFAGVLTIMLAGAVIYKNAGRAIIIFAPAVFLTAAAVYFIRVSKIGLDDYSDEEDNPFSDSEI